jgi:membrane fusion protein (multidrug efflux system)
MRVATAYLALLCTIFLAACGSGNGADKKAGGGAATVTTTVLQPSQWADTIDAIGTAHANESVTLTA